jgi:2-dehydro-3-deoxyphosphogalactonate aldolase
MKITRVDFYPVAVPAPHLGGRYWFFVCVETDSGICGWGEMAFLGAHDHAVSGLAAEVEAIAAAYFVGEDPLARQRLWSRCYQGLTMHHPDYVRVSILSGFDIALWDIAGKHYGAPVYQLLGGAYRDRIRTYSYIYDSAEDTERPNNPKSSNLHLDPEACAERAAAMVEEGFDALKFDPVPQRGGLTGPADPSHLTLDILDRAELTVRRVRETVGAGCDILIGTHGQMTTAAAIRLARRMEPYDPLWFEEPVPPDNAAQMGRVAASTSIPIATGERLVTVWEFERLTAASAASIFQPDLGSCGGITAAMKIAALAEAHYAEMAPHVWAGPVVTAASLQLDSCIPNFLIQESIYRSRGFFDELLVRPFSWDAGYLAVPDSPGIGIDLNVAALEKHRAR